MRRLRPEPEEVLDLESLYEPGTPPAGRPFVRVNMIASLDGSVTVGGLAGGLGGPGDRRLFGALRSLTDVVMVGAGTVRAEDYGPVQLDDDTKARRVARGQTPVPPIAVVTRSCRLDPESRFFVAAEARPIVVTREDVGAEAAGLFGSRADVVAAGEGEVDLSRVLGTLAGRGVRSVLVEGGPTLNRQLWATGLVDELCLTTSPVLVGEDEVRLMVGPSRAEPIRFTLDQVLEEDGFLFLRLGVCHERR